MTNPDDEKTHPLEQAMNDMGDDVESRRAVLQAFVTSRVIVLTDAPWDGRSIPDTEMRLLLVSDGPDQQQAMVAVFTRKEFTEKFHTTDTPFKHQVQVDANWVMLGIPKDAGIMINPNSEPGFRISPEIGEILREAAEKDLAERINRVRPQESDIDE